MAFSEKKMIYSGALLCDFSSRSSSGVESPSCTSSPTVDS